MNIFAISNNPVEAAQWMVDKHVVKMILETAQLLSTAHRILDGEMVEGKKMVPGALPIRWRKFKKWKLPDDRDTVLYSATHINHPSAVWCRASNNNYNWLYAHFLALLDEYTYRYGKVHKCATLVDALRSTPISIPVGYLTPVTPAMPDEYKVEHDSVTSYRNYYRVAKQRMHKWTKREKPEWINV
ncbi:hypothetical protein UFOVP247_164 [uncultured Caudovirales phage]|uniref:Uncharacterized protein n=1 Tax=uncultured Caudovirales phage TaxID=2100421 RepID=A0A6J7X2B8_9CAUD|nr:hypothetical protein UFOVP247_164 [uncultured Caudovirales phage]